MTFTLFSHCPSGFNSPKGEVDEKMTACTCTSSSAVSLTTNVTQLGTVSLAVGNLKGALFYLPRVVITNRYVAGEKGGAAPGDFSVWSVSRENSETAPTNLSRRKYLLYGVFLRFSRILVVAIDKNPMNETGSDSLLSASLELSCEEKTSGVAVQLCTCMRPLTKLLVFSNKKHRRHYHLVKLIPGYRHPFSRGVGR